jgi:hypothetical protein
MQWSQEAFCAQKGPFSVFISYKWQLNISPTYLGFVLSPGKKTLTDGAVVKRQQEKGRWTKGRRRHKVDRAMIRQKVDDKRSTGLGTMTKGRWHEVNRASTDKEIVDGT